MPGFPKFPALLAVCALALTAVAWSLLAVFPAGTASARTPISVSAPTASPTHYTGACPATITFSANVRLEVNGTTTFWYRWVRSDGSTSPIKSQAVTGYGTRTVTVTDSATFTADTTTSQALQVLWPYQVTGSQAHVTVSCQQAPEAPPGDRHAKDWLARLNTGKPTLNVTVEAPDYLGECPPAGGISATGVIQVSRPTVVAYSWMLNGRFAAGGITRVTGTKTLQHTFTPRQSQEGSVSLVVASLYGMHQARDTYIVRCEEPLPPVQASATVSALPGVTVGCPAGVVFTGTVSVNRIEPGGTTVQYRWVGPGYTGPIETLTFAEGDPLSKEVTHTVQVTVSGPVLRQIEFLSPNGTDSNSFVMLVTCLPPAVEASATVTAPETVNAVCPSGLVFITGAVSVNRIETGGTTVQYRWAGPGYDGPTETLTFAEGDPLSKEITHTVEVTVSGTIQRWIEILSPNSTSSDPAQVQVVCGALQISIVDLQQTVDTSACGTPGYGPAITVTAQVQVNGAVRIGYEWEFNGGGGQLVIPGSFQTTGAGTVTVSHRLESSPFTNTGLISARLRITSPGGLSSTLDFSPEPCPSS